MKGLYNETVHFFLSYTSVSALVPVNFVSGVDSGSIFSICFPHLDFIKSLY